MTKDSFTKQISCFSIAGCSEHDRHLAMLWHARLGHVAHKRLKHVDGISKCDYAYLICFVCSIAKQTKIPFPTSRISTMEVFDLINIDLWGPYHLKSITNAVDMLTIIDDFSRFYWTYMLKSKERVFSTLIFFFHYVFTHYTKKVKVFRTNNGTEFLNTSCNSFFQENGTLHQRSYVYSPQQNGVIGRKN